MMMSNMFSTLVNASVSSFLFPADDDPDIDEVFRMYGNKGNNGSAGSSKDDSMEDIETTFIQMMKDAKSKVEMKPHFPSKRSLSPGKMEKKRGSYQNTNPADPDDPELAGPKPYLRRHSVMTMGIEGFNRHRDRFANASSEIMAGMYGRGDVQKEKVTQRYSDSDKSSTTGYPLQLKQTTALSTRDVQSTRDCPSTRTSTRSLRNMVQICEETEKIGIAAAENLDLQRNALNRTKANLHTISETTKDGKRTLDKIERRQNNFLCGCFSIRKPALLSRPKAPMERSFGEEAGRTFRRKRTISGRSNSDTTSIASRQIKSHRLSEDNWLQSAHGQDGESETTSTTSRIPEEASLAHVSLLLTSLHCMAVGLGTEIDKQNQEITQMQNLALSNRSKILKASAKAENLASRVHNNNNNKRKLFGK